MKFKIKTSLILAIALVICSIVIVTSIQEQKVRTQSMMEYLSGFSSEGHSQVQPVNNKVKKVGVKHHKTSHKKKAHNKKNKSFRFKERNLFSMTNGTNATNATAAPGASNSTASNQTDGPLTSAPILMEWFMISSPAFRNSAKFPPVKLWDNTKLTINTDEHYFRLNPAFENTQGAEKPPTEKFFWFRLSGLNIYYSLTKSDINILGAVLVQSISSVTSATGAAVGKGNMTYCFTVADHEGSMWKICGLKQETVNQWVCQIKKLLNEEDAPECGATAAGGESAANATKIIERNITQPIIIIPIPSPMCNDGWNYQKNGVDWECDCVEGKEQAPIDLPNVNAAIDSTVKPLFQYDDVQVTSKVTTLDGQLKENEALKIKLTDNSLRIYHNRFGKVVTMDGAVYYAQEIVIHTPAEHTIEGKIYDMEVQIVHYGQSKGDIAKQLILSFVFEKTPGVYNKFLDDLDIFNLPNPISLERDLTSNIFIPKIFYSSDEEDIPIMKPFSFYTYQGSLTAPPCTENTIMYVASNPLKVGTTALQLFQEALRIPDMMNQKGDVIVSNWIPKSNRSIQPTNGRPVFHYDHHKNCGPDPVKPKPVPKGHYEKIMKGITNYFYVTGEEPSGLPNAFVVSEKEALGKNDSKQQ